ncbi:MAG: hypothetical protein ACK6A9_17040 [Dolichospermum sp.]|jgi:carbonic anhydrase
MSQIVEEVLSANRSYVENFGGKGELLIPPARRESDSYLYGCAT